jgi:myosin-crossreactive antigen
MLIFCIQELDIALGRVGGGGEYLRGESVNGGRFIDNRMTEGLQQMHLFLTIPSL